MINPFIHTRYVVNMQLVKAFGEAFSVFDPYGQLAFYADRDMSMLSYTGDIRVYTEKSMRNQVLSIRYRPVDETFFNYFRVYDVVDTTTGWKVGTLKWVGRESLIKDKWAIMDANEVEVGSIKEDASVLSVLGFLPRQYHGEINGYPVLTFSQQPTVIEKNLSVDFGEDYGGLLDRRLGIAAAVLIWSHENYTSFRVI